MSATQMPKSTLMNCLCKAYLCRQQAVCNLDPTTRKITLGDDERTILLETPSALSVSFPTSWLMLAKQPGRGGICRRLVQVVDASDPNTKTHGGYGKPF